MNLLETWIEDGTIVTLVLAVLVFEIGLFALWRLRGTLRASLIELYTNMAAGGCLALALRASLVGDGPFWVGFWLIAGGTAHLADVLLRLRRA